MLAVFPLTTARDRRWWSHCGSLGSPECQRVSLQDSSRRGQWTCHTHLQCYLFSGRTNCVAFSWSVLKKIVFLLLLRLLICNVWLLCCMVFCFVTSVGHFSYPCAWLAHSAYPSTFHALLVHHHQSLFFLYWFVLLCTLFCLFFC